MWICVMGLHANSVDSRLITYFKYETSITLTFTITTVMMHSTSDQHLLWPGLVLRTANSKERPQMRDALMNQEICICLWWILLFLMTLLSMWLIQTDPLIVFVHPGYQMMPAFQETISEYVENWKKTTST